MNVKIAYLGIPGSYSFIASQCYFSKQNKMIGYQSIKEIFKKISSKSVDYGLVPIENSSTGSIVESYDQLIKNKIYMVNEITLKVHHHLLGSNQKTKIKDIKSCYSHPQALLQCQNFFDGHPWIKPHYTEDSASAAKFLSENKKNDMTAISSRKAAEIYWLRIILRNIEDNKNNFTRFAIVGKTKNQSGNKASLIFTLKHIPGSLFQALKPYAKFGLNLTKIESRPLVGKPWEYIFFVDIEINNNDFFHQMIREMKKVTESITIFGIYQKGKIYES